MTLTPIAERLAVGLSEQGFEHQTFRLRGQRSNPLRHRRGATFSALELSFAIYFIPRNPV